MRILALSHFWDLLLDQEKFMGDDTTIIVPPESGQEDDTYERAGEELVALLTAQAERLGECLARIAELEGRIIQLEGREFAAIEHNHDGFATSEHVHDGYATTEHEHQARTSEERKPDNPPRKQHPYFRKLDEF